MYHQLKSLGTRLWWLVLWSALLLGAIAAVRASGQPAPTRVDPVSQTLARMRELQPRVNHPRSLARAIVSGANLAGVEPRVLVAIAMQETSLIPQHRWYSDDHADLGLFQVNSRTALHYGCNIEGLLAFDPDASARCAGRVLRDKMRQCQRAGLSAPESVGCYHSTNPRFRVPYLERLAKWL